MSNTSKKQVCLPELEHNYGRQGKHKPHKFPSELRLDLVSRDWVVIATGRAKKPEMFRREKKKREADSQKLCPFWEKTKCSIKCARILLFHPWEKKKEGPTPHFVPQENVCFKTKKSEQKSRKTKIRFNTSHRHTN